MWSLGLSCLRNSDNGIFYGENSNMQMLWPSFFFANAQQTRMHNKKELTGKEFES